MFPVKYELGFYIPEDDIPHRHRRESLKPYCLVLHPLPVLIMKRSIMGTLIRSISYPLCPTDIFKPVSVPHVSGRVILKWIKDGTE
jgi:hypothetical protein